MIEDTSEPSEGRSARAPTVLRLARLLVVALCFPGCYRYVPTAPAEIVPRQAVRVELTPDGSRRLDSLLASQPWYGTGSIFSPPVAILVNAPYVDGLVRTTSATELDLLVAHANASDRTFTFGWGEVAVVRRKVVDRVRTWLLVGGALGGGALLIDRLHLSGRPPGSTGGQQGGGDEPLAAGHAASR